MSDENKNKNTNTLTDEEISEVSGGVKPGYSLSGVGHRQCKPKGITCNQFPEKECRGCEYLGCEKTAVLHFYKYRCNYFGGWSDTTSPFDFWGLYSG